MAAVFNGAMSKVVQRILLLLVLIVLLVVGGGYGWLVASLPKTEGEIEVPGFTSAVQISRSADGVPTIRADNWADAWAGLGFVHAQDRLWQMVSLRRFALGRLSEVLGTATIDLDIQQRRLDLARLTEAQLARLTPDTREALSAYARGVNAFLEVQDGTPPPEFQALRFSPEPWHAADGLLWGRLMAYQMSGRWRNDVQRPALAARIGLMKAQDLWPGLNVLPQISKLGRPPAPTHAPPIGASNAWAVRKDGKTLLAGDPHLGFSIPGVWYLARLEVGDDIVEGATAPGSPFVIIGRNKNVAWSFTTNEADLQDVMHVTDADVTERLKTSIAIKNNEPREAELLFAAGAPVVMGGLIDGGGTDGLALLATALQPDDTTPNALYGLNKAESVDGALEALWDFHAPLQNVTLADTDGRIALAVAGLIPDRSDEDGRFPLPNSTVPWRTVHGLDAIPAIINPAQGFVGNANERQPEMDDAPFDIAGRHPSPARAERMRALLTAADTLDAAKMTAMQLDVRDVTFDAWKDAIATLPDDGIYGAAREALSFWQGDMRRELTPPLIFATWMAHLKQMLFADELQGGIGEVRSIDPAQMRGFIDEDSIWCDDVGTIETEDCTGIVAKAFKAAVDALVRTYGDDLSDWRWGKVHKARFEHSLLSRLPYGYLLFDRDIETDGGDRTLNRGASRSAAGLAGVFDHVHGAGFRALHDLAGGPSKYMAVPGQSGNPMSEHYADLLERWRDGKYLTFEAEAASQLRLIPAQNR